MSSSPSVPSQNAPLPRDDRDHLFHPRSEEELCQLVRFASDHGLPVRVIGSGHSVTASILSPRLDAINLSLDHYKEVTFNADGTVTVQAGCFLGQHAPDAWENTLFAKLEHKGLAVPDMGGITHQAVGGFTTMGCAGGSLQAAYSDAIIALSLVDGQGTVRAFRRGTDPEFEAVLVSMGLMGVFSTLTFQPIPRFDIIGNETIYAVEQAPIDLFGEGTDSRPSLERFLRETEYTRLLWWPQRGAERVVIWQARKMTPADYTDQTAPGGHFTPKPYREFPVILGSQLPAQVAASVFYNLSVAWPELLARLIQDWRLCTVAQGLVAGLYEAYLLPFVIDLFAPLADAPSSRTRATVPPPSELFSEETRHLVLSWKPVATALPTAMAQGSAGRRAARGAALELLPAHVPPPTGTLKLTTEAIDFWGALLARHPEAARPLAALQALLPDPEAKLPRYYQLHVSPELLPSVARLLETRAPETDGRQEFWDAWYGSLPMDNDVSDVLMPTEFTELWIPIGRTAEVMRRLRDFYEAGGLGATGTYSCEIYAAKASDAWLSPSYQQDMVRIDVFWFRSRYDAPDAIEAFYRQYWELLEEFDFRPHWAKYLPDLTAMGPDFLARRYPQWAQWRKLRVRMDPKQIFVTDYWRQLLGLPPP